MGCCAKLGNSGKKYKPDGNTFYRYDVGVPTGSISCTSIPVWRKLNIDNFNASWIHTYTGCSRMVTSAGGAGNPAPVELTGIGISNQRSYNASNGVLTWYATMSANMNWYNNGNREWITPSCNVWFHIYCLVPLSLYFSDIKKP